MYGETFYSRHTAQHQLHWSQMKIRKHFFLAQFEFVDILRNLVLLVELYH